MSRQEFMVSRDKEIDMICILGSKLIAAGCNASNSTLVAVSTDYSSIAQQILRHKLTYEGEIADGFGVDVPYPDQVWDEQFEANILSAFELAKPDNPILILVEAGVIRGSNYRNLTLLINERYPDLHVITTTLFENVSSAFKSDFVVEYYDDSTHDLTFEWERYNKHWK